MTDSLAWFALAYLAIAVTGYAASHRAFDPGDVPKAILDYAPAAFFFIGAVCGVVEIVNAILGVLA